MLIIFLIFFNCYSPYSLTSSSSRLGASSLMIVTEHNTSLTASSSAICNDWCHTIEEEKEDCMAKEHNNGHQYLNVLKDSCNKDRQRTSDAALRNVVSSPQLICLNEISEETEEEDNDHFADRLSIDSNIEEKQGHFSSSSVIANNKYDIENVSIPFSREDKTASECEHYAADFVMSFKLEEQCSRQSQNVVSDNYGNVFTIEDKRSNFCATGCRCVELSKYSCSSKCVLNDADAMHDNQNSKLINTSHPIKYKNENVITFRSKNFSDLLENFRLLKHNRSDNVRMPALLKKPDSLHSEHTVEQCDTQQTSVDVTKCCNLV